MRRARSVVGTVESQFVGAQLCAGCALPTSPSGGRVGDSSALPRLWSDELPQAARRHHQASSRAESGSRTRLRCPNLTPRRRTMSRLRRRTHSPLTVDMEACYYYRRRRHRHRQRAVLGAEARSGHGSDQVEAVRDPRCRRSSCVIDRARPAGAGLTRLTAVLPAEHGVRATALAREAQTHA